MCIALHFYAQPAAGGVSRHHQQDEFQDSCGLIKGCLLCVYDWNLDRFKALSLEISIIPRVRHG